ncbi:Crp/Fnr family transcriptional regulator [Paracoccus contaminans]|uniref:HTH crp-type domain-containing protein n=1 Tax=Paracoccus contaminans TaxID=1945662 RepID=A0A1W6CYK6_9RHOB|nr:Crp/Fnr family transcriptional regulator [Paracoccus contaminans]ARJ69953.1 hypothetical protein B0A89_10235 [Paracoccus contaminans]
MQGIDIVRAYAGLLSEGDAQLLASFLGTETPLGPRQCLARAHQPLDRSVYLVRGFVSRHRADRLGRRQILSVQIPGDFVDLSSYRMGHLDHDVETLGEGAVRDLSYRAVGHLHQTAPALYDMLWRIVLIDAAIQRYQVFRVGRLAGRARIANFLAEMLVRLYARGLCGLDGYELPISQSELGEACGMTAVHTNRMISELRAEGICSFSGFEVRLNDFAALVATGQYDWDHLFLPAATSAALSRLAGRKPAHPLPAAAACWGRGTGRVPCLPSAS